MSFRKNRVFSRLLPVVTFFVLFADRRAAPQYHPSGAGKPVKEIPLRKPYVSGLHFPELVGPVFDKPHILSVDLHVDIKLKDILCP